MARRRKYEMRRRLEGMGQTRDRIAEAAFELHGTIGPARATISAIADQAGVQRHTVYRHFPDMVELIRACTEHGIRVTNPPDAADWRAVEDAGARLGMALGEVYAYFRSNERLLANIFRDMAVMPELVEGSAAFVERFTELHQALVEPLVEGGGPPDLAMAAVGHALDFATWRSLTSKGLTDDQARDAMVAFVGAMAWPTGSAPSRSRCRCTD